MDVDGGNVCSETNSQMEGKSGEVPIIIFSEVTNFTIILSFSQRSMDNVSDRLMVGDPPSMDEIDSVTFNHRPSVPVRFFFQPSRTQFHILE